ncbi:uncharacterized protein LOC112554488 [Pomacea canaliculata]|uniref:uncharacterized protein LOC112554488 n=1 Tax=Pomacea canaliculata TaxID=400727 RepID=UPI000D72CAEC|nr:uncharacterized protein LOC112554488 [Pomacea canaliculata]
MLEGLNDLMLSTDILLPASSSKAAAVRCQGSKDGIMGRQDRLQAVFCLGRFAGILGRRRLTGCAKRGLLLLLFAVVMATADSSHPRSSWSEWSPCSRSCGTGVSRRVQSCGQDDSDCHAKLFSTDFAIHRFVRHPLGPKR